MEKLFAVRASFVAEALSAERQSAGLEVWPRCGRAYAICHDDGADHAGAQVALLAWRDKVGGRHARHCTVFVVLQREARNEGAYLGRGVAAVLDGSVADIHVSVTCNKRAASRRLAQSKNCEHSHLAHEPHPFSS